MHVYNEGYLFLLMLYNGMGCNVIIIVINCILPYTPNDYHDYSLAFVHGHHVFMYVYVCTGVSKELTQYMCTKNLVLYGWTGTSGGIYHLHTV